MYVNVVQDDFIRQKGVKIKQKSEKNQLDSYNPRSIKYLPLSIYLSNSLQLSGLLFIVDESTSDKWNLRQLTIWIKSSGPQRSKPWTAWPGQMRSYTDSSRSGWMNTLHSAFTGEFRQCCAPLSSPSLVSWKWIYRTNLLKLNHAHLIRV